ncbi:hypothetical protein LTR84_004540 [Exophiala bonariae]|uniref:Septin-type G domain-containing protein n=1 Tax=Exophiala bonariae TaxID=1690606 RepID=A0AAV9NMZ4_9EURO|nr:hypothetical protein LTR84_004540 [Exophiala bonariae]
MSARSNPVRKKRNAKKAIRFSMMVCGASGTGRITPAREVLIVIKTHLGKTTFVNTLYGKRVLLPKEDDGSAMDAHLESDVRIKPVTLEMDLDSDGTRMFLTIVDTPGFGDQIDNESSFNDIVGYLERQYDDMLAEESRIKRNARFQDNEVHALLYFITPTGHGLRELDIELMKRLSPRVNVIPVIGKADTHTPEELQESKNLIMADIEHYKIPVYQFPDNLEEDDGDTIQENTELRSLLPFAIVGSEDTINVTGRRIPARKYPWGVVEVDNPRHSDFLAIKTALLHTHMTTLKEITHDYLYENYRTEKLSNIVGGDAGSAQDGTMNPHDLANQSVIIREEQLRREEEQLREIELKVQKEIDEKRQELLVRENQLRELEARMQRAQAGAA